jgi:hypothetical protein
MLSPFTHADILASGSAAHGDYVFGWKGNTLQLAMDNGCNLNTDCKKAGITAQTPAQYNACTKKPMSPEPVDGCKLNKKPILHNQRQLTMTALGIKALPLGDVAVKG